MKSSKNKKLLAFFLAAMGLSVNSLNVSAENKQISTENNQISAENKQISAENEQISAENKQMPMRENIKFFFGMQCDKLKERKKLDELADKICKFNNGSNEIELSDIAGELYANLYEIANRREEKQYNSELYNVLMDKTDKNDNIINSYPGNINGNKTKDWIASVKALVHGGNLTVFNGKIKTALKNLANNLVNDVSINNKEDEQYEKFTKIWSTTAYYYDENTKSEKKIKNGIKCYLDTEGNLLLKLSKGVNKIKGFLSSSVIPASAIESVKSITIPESVEIIGDYSFFVCSNLKEITIPNSVKQIGEGAFMSCSNLEEIKIPNSVKRIDNHAFMNCSNLKKIEISKSVEEIGLQVFSGCENLKTVIVEKGISNGCQERIRQIFSNRDIEGVPANVKLSF